MRMLKWIMPLAAVGLVAVANGKAQAQAVYGADDQMITVSSASFNNLLDRIEALETAVTQEEAPVPAGGKGYGGGPAGYGEGWEDTSGEKWSTDVGGRIMWDYVNFANVDNILPNAGGFAGQDYWEFRRVRIFIDGEGYGVYEYKLQLDFEPEGEDTDDKDSGVSYKDLYIGMRDVCFFNHIRFGHQKECHGLEVLTSSKYITFMERYAGTKVFAAERNVGLQAFNTNCTESIGWQFGAFFPRRFDDVDEVSHETINDNQGYDLVARVIASPYYCEGGRHCVHLGAGVWYSEPEENSIRFRIRPGTHEGDRIIDATFLNDVDSFISYNLEAAAVWGPLSVQGEFFVNDYDSTAIGDNSAYGAYAFASYFLTGENRVYNRYYGRFDRVRPFTNFWAVPTCEGCCVGRGAWELAARWQYFDNSEDPAVNAGEAHGYTVGLNWYLNPYLRTMFNYEHWDADYNNGEEGELDWLGMRVQWDF